MEKLIYKILEELEESKFEISNELAVYVQYPLTFSSFARISKIIHKENGDVDFTGGIDDGKELLATTSYIQSFMFYDWTLEDVFYEIRERINGVFRDA